MSGNERQGGETRVGRRSEGSGTQSIEDSLSSRLDNTRPFSPEEVRASLRVGPYQLDEQIGSGGQGSVWLARQEQPIRRTVAVKLLRIAESGGELLARFESERQALAMMDHPFIARVYETGLSKLHGPYFAMEYVPGEPLTDYCDHHQLSIGERLSLFLDVCDAVQHAHQKGIIHRDLKPSNVLVMDQEGTAVPRVIDFGLAKAIEAEIHLTDRDLTRAGDVRGTPKYMSPEQACGALESIDTRCDIYSLGVLLYELLCGEAPLDRETLSGKPLHEVYRLIAEQDPPRPSDRIAGMDSEQLEKVTDNRQIDVRRLTRLLAGDLNWIAMQSIHKEPKGRYQTVAELAADVQRYLNDDPVQARPPTRSYRARKFARKHRMGLTVAAALVVALLVTSGVSVYSYFRVDASLDSEKSALAKASAALAAEKEAKAEAEQRAKRNERVVDVFLAAFEVPDPKNDLVTAEFTPVDVLRQALEEIKQSDFSDDPLTEAELLFSIGRSLHALGEYNHAIEALERTVEINSEVRGSKRQETLTSRNSLSIYYADAGRWDDAIELGERVLEIRRRELGKHHLDTLTSMTNLATYYTDAGRWEEAIEMGEEVVELRKIVLGMDHSETLMSMSNVALTYSRAGRWTDAIQLGEQVLEIRKKTLGENHPDTLVSLNNLAAAYADDGRWDKAITLSERGVELRRKKLGINHPRTMTSMNNLASYYADAGRWNEAIELGEKVLELGKNTPWSNHPHSVIGMANLALAYSGVGRLKDALKLGERVLEIRQREHGTEHFGTLTAMHNLAHFYAKSDRFDDAIELGKRVVEQRKHTIGETHPHTLKSMSNLAAYSFAAGRPDDAIKIGEFVVKSATEKLGEQHPFTLSLMGGLATYYLNSGRYDDGIEVSESLIALRKEKLGEDHPDTLNSIDFLQNLLLRVQSEKARKVIEHWLDILKKSERKNSAMIARATTSLADYLAGQGSLTDARQYSEAALRNPDIDKVERQRAQVIRGLYFAKQGDFVQAETILLEAFHELNKRIGDLKQRTWYAERTCERIIEMYRLWEQPAKVVKWEAKIEEIRHRIDAGSESHSDASADAMTK